MKTQHKDLPGVLRWKIGRTTVTVINDGFFEANASYFTNLGDKDAAEILGKAFRKQVPTLTTNLFLVESEDFSPTLIDVGMGDKLAPQLQGNLLKALEFIGFPADEIGNILITHLHGDHFYGLAAKNGNRNFPNAKVWLSKTEHDFWIGNEALQGLDKQNGEDAKNALKGYELELFSGTSILPGITTVPLAGHTPGQTGFLLESDGEKLLFCADLMTIPALQSRFPEVGFATDVDHDKAVETRISTLKMAAEQRLLLAGAHFEFPCLSYVEETSEGFRLVPKQWF